MVVSEIEHVTTRAAWESAVAAGEYRGDSLAAEGFIHCCTPDQSAGVCERYFRGKTGLVVLKIDAEGLKAPLTWEKAPGSDEMFPHLYGALNLDAVVGVVPLVDAGE